MNDNKTADTSAKKRQVTTTAPNVGRQNSVQPGPMFGEWWAVDVESVQAVRLSGY
ncbi:hypothetical protein AB0H71_29990 [Nocardia sp. NPDC050697]|uniref:hypothetical protein n=1 Tax=Nocardia sp. NPDC050697 TaxID=3155158 RepID=UPI003407B00A